MMHTANDQTRRHPPSPFPRLLVNTRHAACGAMMNAAQHRTHHAPQSLSPRHTLLVRVQHARSTYETAPERAAALAAEPVVRRRGPLLTAGSTCLEQACPHARARGAESEERTGGAPERRRARARHSYERAAVRLDVELRRAAAHRHAVVLHRHVLGEDAAHLETRWCWVLGVGCWCSPGVFLSELQQTTTDFDETGRMRASRRARARNDIRQNEQFGRSSFVPFVVGRGCCEPPTATTHPQAHTSGTAVTWSRICCCVRFQ